MSIDFTLPDEVETEVGAQNEKAESNRISKDLYYLDIAASVAKRSTCLRRRYGAVLVNNDEIIATGYNGAPRGEDNCCDRGVCERQKRNIPQGERYELCRSVHAEQNAIISAARKDMIGATLYLTGIDMEGNRIVANPCDMCKRFIRNAGIKEVIGSDPGNTNYHTQLVVAWSLFEEL